MKRLSYILMLLSAFFCAPQARGWYDPTFQRWIQRDPIGEMGGINLYQFNRNNPFRWIDPHGLDPALDALNDMVSSGDPAYGASGAAITGTLVNEAWTGYFTAMAELAASEVLGAAAEAVGNAIGNALGSSADGLGFGTPKPPVECPKRITVLGSGRDVAPYVGKPGFNTFTGKGIAPAELDTQNALWLNNAIQNGDQIWLLTDPAAHQALMNQLNLQSAFLNLELPMLNHYSGVNAIPKYVTGAAP